MHLRDNGNPMKFAAISDVHVKTHGDPAEDLLLKFLRNPDVQSSDVILLLGDIFDLMIGPHVQYFTRFQNYFNEIKFLVKSGKKICYVEGNHDFHIKNLYEKFFKYNPDLNKNLFVLSSEFEFVDSGKKIYFAHGDDIELNNPNYRLFKSIVTSSPLTFYANHLMPHFLIKSVGEFSSRQSRKRNNKRYQSDSDLLPVKNNFRESIEFYYKKNPCDIYVLGHSHVKDLYESVNGFTYVNNGYAQHTKTYISIDNGNISFRPV